MVNFAHDHRSFSGVILGQIIAGDCLLRTLVDDADIRIFDHAEVLLAFDAVVDVDNKNNPFDALRYLGQIDLDLFGIIHAAHFAADKVIAAVVDAAGCMILVVKENDFLGAWNFAARIEHQDGRVDINIDLLLKHAKQAAARLNFLPAKTNKDIGKLRAVRFAQVDFLTFCQ